jgi:hypothetical protein
MAAAALLAPSGCSLSDEEEPKPVSGAPAAVAATVDRLERAVARRDYGEICDQLFTDAARQRAGGEDCERQVRSAAGRVTRPSIRVTRIGVNGERATVGVRTRAEGQARVADELLLRREDGRWLVEALR